MSGVETAGLSKNCKNNSCAITHLTDIQYYNMAWWLSNGQGLIETRSS